MSTFATCLCMRCVPVIQLSPQSPRILSHGDISKMADGGGNEMLEENIEQHLSRIVKGQTFSNAFLCIPFIKWMQYYFLQMYALEHLIWLLLWKSWGEYIVFWLHSWKRLCNLLS